MANRSNPNPRRSSGSGDMDETQVFRPVRGGGQTRGSAGDGGYSNNNGYYDGTYDDSYNNGYDGYDNHAPPVIPVPKERQHYLPVREMSRAGKVLRVAM